MVNRRVRAIPWGQMKNQTPSKAINIPNLFINAECEVFEVMSQELRNESQINALHEDKSIYIDTYQ